MKHPHAHFVRCPFGGRQCPGRAGTDAPHHSVLLENEPGALSRVVGLFSARDYNIETLTVAPTEDASLSRMTMSVSAQMM